MNRKYQLNSRSLVKLVAIWGLMASGGYAGVIFSDDFNRTDSPTGLGSTAEGYAWQRRDITAGSPLYMPGIRSNQMVFDYGGTNGVDIAYLSHTNTKVKDFDLTFDLATPGNVGAQGFTVNFRMTVVGAAVSDAGTNTGYSLRISNQTGTVYTATLMSDYGLTQVGAYGDGVDGTSVRLVAESNRFKVWLDRSLVIDYTDSSTNPATAGSGFFSLQSNPNRNFTIDNLVVNQIPEPSSVSLLMVSCGGLLLLRRVRC